VLSEVVIEDKAEDNEAELFPNIPQKGNIICDSMYCSRPPKRLWPPSCVRPMRSLRFLKAGNRCSLFLQPFSFPQLLGPFISQKYVD
jgi:hypothetical protein